MATENALQSISKEASADLSARQYCFMVVNSDGRLETPDAGAAVDGILQDKPDAAGRVGKLSISGQSKLVVGAAVAAGANLTPGTNGKGVTAGTGDVVACKALEAGTGDGSIISVLLNRQAEPIV